jgi:putative flavoprotein involved in K+ transport
MTRPLDGITVVSLEHAIAAPFCTRQLADLAAAGVEHFPAKVTGVHDGRPVLDDGTAFDVRNVIWCTGFRKDTSWIQIPVTGSDGWPEQSRGVSPDHPGLYFVGLPFLQAFASMLTGGVGRDAAYVAKHIAKRVVVRSPEAVA